MTTATEYMRRLIDELNGTVEPKKAKKPTVTPPNTVGVGIALHESKLREPNTDMPYPSFMHELVAKHPEIRNDVRIFPYKDGPGWLIKPKEGDQIPNVTFNTIREACLEKGCKISKTNDGNIEISKPVPISPDSESGDEWGLSIGMEAEPENPVQMMNDLEALVGKQVSAEDHKDGWHLFWIFPNKEEAIEAKEFVSRKHPELKYDIQPMMPGISETISPEDMWNKVDGTNESVTDEALNVSGGWGVHDGNVAKHRNNIKVITDAMIENIDQSIQNQYDNVTIRVQDTVSKEAPHGTDGNEIMDIDVRWQLTDVENGYNILFNGKPVCAIADQTELKDTKISLERLYGNEGWGVQVRDTGIHLQAVRKKAS